MCDLLFSSRRRHTRSLCDWSSDVCSSDLKQKTAYERSEEHTSELQSHSDLVCRLLLEKKQNNASDTDNDTAEIRRHDSRIIQLIRANRYLQVLDTQDDAAQQPNTYTQRDT